MKRNPPRLVFWETIVWKDICGGGFRVRALRETGNMWEADPACYLTDEEIRVLERHL